MYKNKQCSDIRVRFGGMELGNPVSGAGGDETFAGACSMPAALLSGVLIYLRIATIALYHSEAIFSAPVVLG